ncbi:MAG TPA: peptidoglycan-binding domain-containing protein [Candidatus Paceibacterota bacterium]|nr:peptidoglycan-binding domain-containing protein [Candidatus Paceibacterota bacterium]
MNKIIKLFILISICIVPAIAKAECPLNFKNLSISSQTNNDKANIIRLQSILYINNLYTGPITGYYGNLTKTAINRFKEINGLKPDGIVDTETTKLICDQYA